MGTRRGFAAVAVAGVLQGGCASQPGPTGSAGSPSESLPLGAGYGLVTAPADPLSTPVWFVGGDAFVDAGGHDSLYLNFRSAAPPCVLRYVDPPVRDTSTGARVPVEGSAFLQVRCPGVAGVRLENGDSGGYDSRPGASRFSDPSTHNITEVVLTGLRGTDLTLVVGLRHRAPFGGGVIGGDAGLQGVHIVFLR